jgi:hypothetical protein
MSMRCSMTQLALHVAATWHLQQLLLAPKESLPSASYIGQNSRAWAGAAKRGPQGNGRRIAGQGGGLPTGAATRPV